MLMPLFEAPRNEDLVVWEVAGAKEILASQRIRLCCRVQSRQLASPDVSQNTAVSWHPSTPEIFVALVDTATWTEVSLGQPVVGGSFSFSADGKRLALGGFDRQRNVRFVRVTDPTTGKELFSLADSVGGDIALNADGTILALAGTLGSTQIEIWDLNKRRRHGHPARTLRLAQRRQLRRTDGRLASCAWDNTIKFWDPHAGQDVRQITQPSTAFPVPELLAPGGSRLAYGQSNSVILFLGPIRTVTLVDVATGRISRIHSPATTTAR